MLELRSTAGRLAVPGGRAVLLGQTQGAQAGRGSSDSSARGGAAGSVTALVFGGNPVSHREPVLGGGGRGAGPGDAAKAEAGVRRPADAAEEQPAGVPRCGAPCTPAPALGGAWAPALLCLWLPLDWKHPKLPARPGPSRGPPHPPCPSPQPCTAAPVPGEQRRGPGPTRSSTPAAGSAGWGAGPALPAVWGERHRCVHGHRGSEEACSPSAHDGDSADPSARGSVVNCVCFFSGSILKHTPAGILSTPKCFVCGFKTVGGPLHRLVLWVTSPPREACQGGFSSGLGV